MLTRLFTCVLLTTTLACGGDPTPAAAPHAAFEGEWRVINKGGVENGQTIAFAADSITLTTLGRPKESKATYEADGDVVKVQYLGGEYVLKMGADDKHARFDGSAVKYGLVRD